MFLEGYTNFEESWLCLYKVIFNRVEVDCKLPGEWEVYIFP